VLELLFDIPGRKPIKTRGSYKTTIHPHAKIMPRGFWTPCQDYAKKSVNIM